MASGEVFELDPVEYWREPSEDIEVGDVFVDVPLLSLKAQAKNDEDEWGADRIYLATAQDDLALLFKKFAEGWWFLPVLTPDSFNDAARFGDLLEQAVQRVLPGWFPLPPLDPAFPALSRHALVCTLRPTLHRAVAFEGSEDMRLASLTRNAYGQLCEGFERAFAES